MNFLTIKINWLTDEIISIEPYAFLEENLNIPLYSRLEDHYHFELTYIVNIDGYIDYFKNGIRALKRLPRDAHNYVIGYKRKNKLKAIKNRINEKQD